MISELPDFPCKHAAIAHNTDQLAQKGFAEGDAMHDYFSDRERGSRSRTEETISSAAWGGIVALMKSLVATGAFGFKYPDLCPDGAGVSGTDENALSLGIEAEISGLAWNDSYTVPDTLLVLDFIEFCHQSIAKPIQGGYHSFLRHYHLSFDPDAGKSEFREAVNRIFARNGIVYDLQENGQIIRLMPPVLEEMLSMKFFDTGDTILDQMLEESRLKFLNRDPKVRREAVERLWDCWERLKSLENPQNKKESITTLISKAANDPAFVKLLDDEARSLTEIGNSFHIRHSEVNQSAITDSTHVDYLFHRLFSIIHLFLKKR